MTRRTGALLLLLLGAVAFAVWTEVRPSREATGYRPPPPLTRDQLLDLSQTATPSDIPLLQEMSRSLDHRERLIAVTRLLTQFPAARIDGTACLQELIDILRFPEPKGSMSELQVRAGTVLVSHIPKKFSIGPTPGVCGTPALEASELIRKGQATGGTEGRAMVARGERLSAEFSAQMAHLRAETDRRNLAERKKLLAWCDGEGASFIKSHTAHQ